MKEIDSTILKYRGCLSPPSFGIVLEGQVEVPKRVQKVQSPWTSQGFINFSHLKGLNLKASRLETARGAQCFHATKCGKPTRPVVSRSYGYLISTLEDLKSIKITYLKSSKVYWFHPERLHVSMNCRGGKF